MASTTLPDFNLDRLLDRDGIPSAFLVGEYAAIRAHQRVDYDLLRDDYPAIYWQELNALLALTIPRLDLPEGVAAAVLSHDWRNAGDAFELASAYINRPRSKIPFDWAGIMRMFWTRYQVEAFRKWAVRKSVREHMSIEDQPGVAAEVVARAKRYEVELNGKQIMNIASWMLTEWKQQRRHEEAKARRQGLEG
jgi:hypothetical protein